MKALPLEQKHLLELQQLDLQIAKVKHTLRSDPLHKKIAELEGRSNDLRVAKVALQADLDAKNRQANAVEAEIDKVRGRREIQQERLDSGKIPLRDMSPVQHEIASMDARIGTLEDEQLGFLADAEQIEANIISAQEAREAIAKDLAEAEFELSAKGGVSEAELRGVNLRREKLITLLPPDLVDEYTRLQGRLGVSVVVEVRDGRPIGSPVDFSMAELAEINAFPKDEIYISDDYEYIVVRTSSE
jgi:Zn-ribbon protein, possibly nucleic acid-binding